MQRKGIKRTNYRLQKLQEKINHYKKEILTATAIIDNNKLTPSIFRLLQNYIIQKTTALKRLEEQQKELLGEATS